MNNDIKTQKKSYLIKVPARPISKEYNGLFHISKEKLFDKTPLHLWELPYPSFTRI
jgi:hypothetical protein